MKKILVFCVMALSLGFVSCGSDDDDSSTSNSSIKDLGNGIYNVNGHKFVDLGLPSGLLWAETNIGAATAADDGDYYAWGETATKTDYSWSTYK